MNFYNPYTMISPYYQVPTSTGLFRGLFGRLGSGINWGSILNNTQRTLNIVNQTIPLVKQTGPIVKNARTMFRVMNEFKKADSPIQENGVRNEYAVEKNNINNDLTNTPNSISTNNVKHTKITSNTPTFFQ